MRKRITKINNARSSIRLRYRNRVRQCRLRALIISEAELSRRTGIERTTLSTLENNRRFLSIEHALLIKEALGCSLDDLYEPILPTENSDFANKAIQNANDKSRST
jgi:transcriptional regulator with XRE-family HTH domain